MDSVSKFFSALLAAIMTREASVGASVMQGLAAIGVGWAQDQMHIVSDAQTHFHDAYQAEAAKGSDVYHSIAIAAQSTLDKFCSDEKAEMTTEIAALVTLWKSSAEAAIKAAIQ